MKKLLSAVLAIVLVLSLGACKFTGAKKEIKEDLEASLDAIILGENIEDVYAYTLGEEIQGSGMKDEVSKAVREHAEYKIKNIREDGNTAEADVVITAPDSYQIITDIQQNSQDGSADSLISDFENALDGDFPTTDTNVTITLVYDEDTGKWKIEDSEDLNNAFDGIDKDKDKEDLADLSQNTFFENPSASVIGNGGSAVVYKGNVFYFAPDRIPPVAASNIADVVKYRLMMKDSNGNITELSAQVPYNAGNVYVINDTIYTTNIENDNHCVYAFSQSGEHIDTIDNFEICGADFAIGQLILRECPEAAGCYMGYSVYHPAKQTITELTGIPENDQFGFASNGIGYFYTTQMSGESDSFTLYSCDLNTGETKDLSRNTLVSEHEAPIAYASPYYFQETDKSIYCLYGYQGGSGGFFQEGNISRYDKATGETEVITPVRQNYDGGIPAFYVFDDNGTEFLLCKDGHNNVLINTETLEESTSDMLVGLLRTPIKEEAEGGAKFWYYAEADGKISEILPEVNLNTESEYTYIEDVSYTGSHVIYSLDYHKINESPQLGWRDATICYKTETYMYNCETGETTLLNTVQ